MASIIPNVVKKSMLDLLATHSFKCALYTSSATFDKNSTVYSPTNEVSGAGYTVGGFAVIPTVATVGDTATLTFADVLIENVTITAHYSAIYDLTDGNKLVYIGDYGMDKGVINGNFLADFPAAVLTVG